MTVAAVFENAAHVGGSAAIRSLTENAGFIMNYVAQAQPREFCVEAAPHAAPGAHI